MGGEIFSYIFYPEIIICLLTAFLFWFFSLKADHPTMIGLMTGYLPLITGFAISMAGLALLTVWTSEDLTSALMQLVFVLPPMCFVVIPCTARLLRTHRLTLYAIGLRAGIGWLTLMPIGWLLRLGVIIPPYSLLGSMKSNIAAVLIYGLPIPLTSLWFFRRPAEDGDMRR
jgi:hypothetical protein